MANPTASDIARGDELYDKIHRKSWSRRLAGVLGAMTLVGTYGLIIGTVAAFIPSILGSLGFSGIENAALPEAWQVVKMAASFAFFGSSIGAVAGADVGSAAGAVAAAMEESPAKEKGASPAQEKSLAPKKEKVKLFDWKVAAFWVVPVAAFGAIMGIAPPASIVPAMLGFVPGSNAAIAGMAAIFAMMGICWGAKNSVITNNIANYYTQTFRGNFLGAPAQEMAVAPQKETAVAAEQTVEEPSTQKSFASSQKKFSLQGIIERADGKSTEIIIR